MGLKAPRAESGLPETKPDRKVPDAKHPGLFAPWGFPGACQRIRLEYSRTDRGTDTAVSIAAAMGRMNIKNAKGP